MEGRTLQKLVRTIAVSGLAFALNYLISLVLTPYVTNRMGTDAFGFVTLARTCTQYGTIVTFSLNAYAARFITLEYHKGDLHQANVYYSSVFWGDVGMGTALLAIALPAVAFLERFLVIPEGLVADVKLLFVLVFISFWITTAFTAFCTTPYVCNKLDISGIFKGLSYVAEALVMLLLFACLPDRLWYVGLALMAAAGVIAFSGILINRKYVPELSASPKNFSAEAVKQMVLNGLWYSANQLGDMLNSGLDLFFCNLMLTPLAMGQVAIVKTMDNLFHTLYMLVGQAFHPMFLKSYGSGDRSGLLGELKLSMKMSGMLSNIIFAGFAVLGPVFYRLWIPGEDIDLVYSLTMITIGASLATGSVYPLYYIYTLTLKKEFPCIMTILSGVCNVAAMYIGIRWFGAGTSIVVWTTTVVMLMINLISNPLYMARSLQLPWYTFYPEIFRNLLSCAVLLGLFRLFSMLCMPSAWLSLIACAGVYAVAAAPVHLLLTCRRQDWQLLKKMAKRG